MTACPGHGRGSTFSIRIEAEDQAGKRGASSPLARAPASLRTKVLVVDDNHDAGDLLAMAIEGLGCEVRVARDGQDGLEMAAGFRPAVVVMDLGMPRMNGYEAAAAIRASEWGRAMLLVALSGWGQEDDRRRAHQAGFDHHLVKPADLHTLAEIIGQGDDNW